MEFDEGDIFRFLRFVEPLPSGCWYWTGARSRGKGNRKWYGSFRVKGKTVRAHRFACEALKGEKLPPGHHRDHLCCFSMCVNPEHIQIVSKETNQLRKVAFNGKGTLDCEDGRQLHLDIEDEHRGEDDLRGIIARMRAGLR